MKKILLTTIISGTTLSCVQAPDRELRSQTNSVTDNRSMPQILNDRRSFLTKLDADASNQGCSKTWEKITQDGKLDIVIANGYFDAEFRDMVVVGDASYRSTLTEHFTSPCIGGYNACGFQIQENNIAMNKTVLKKTGQDRNGQPLAISITLTNSSISMMDEDNRGKNLEQQKAFSAAAKEVFDNGIKNSDIVFYFGHARDGGGPDFSFPRLSSGTHVDYDWYQANRPGLKSLIENIKPTNKQIKLLGLFACASKPHFYNAIIAADKDLGLILSSKVTEAETLKPALVGAVDAAIGQKCNASFQKSIDLDPNKPINLINFF